MAQACGFSLMCCSMGFSFFSLRCVSLCECFMLVVGGMGEVMWSYVV